MPLAGIRSVLLTGPTSGLPGGNFEAFATSTVALRALDLVVFSPHERDDAGAMLRADALVTLPGWEDSPACRIEATFAEALGKPVVSLGYMLTKENTADPRTFVMLASAS